MRKTENFAEDSKFSSRLPVFLNDGCIYGSSRMSVARDDVFITRTLQWNSRDDVSITRTQ